MIDEPTTPPTDAEGGRTDDYLSRWRDGWQDHSDGPVRAPSSHYQGIDWTLVQTAHGETGLGRV